MLWICLKVIACLRVCLWYLATTLHDSGTMLACRGLGLQSQAVSHLTGTEGGPYFAAFWSDESLVPSLGSFRRRAASCTCSHCLAVMLISLNMTWSSGL